MEILLYVAAGLAATVVAVLLVVSFFLPASYRVERRVTMRGRTDAIFEYLNNLQHWPTWTAWTVARYPDMQTTFSGPQRGVGAVSGWTGKSVGVGSLKLTHSDPQRGIEYDLDFDNGKILSHGTITMAASDDSVTVTWANSGQLGRNPISRYFGLLMDRMMGPDFQKGLETLKSKIEAA